MGGAAILIIVAIVGMLLGAAVAALLFWLSRRSKTMKEPDSNAEIPTEMERPRKLDEAVAVPVPPVVQDQHSTHDHLEALEPGIPWLDGIGGIVAGQRIEISQVETVIGRSRVCDVQIHDPKISRQHAMLRLYKGRYFIQDMQSSRGTIVNNKRIETHLLQDGDQVRLGDSMLVFHLNNT